MRALAAALALALLAGPAAGQARLSPADPQPEGLEQGLQVFYVYPRDVKFLDQAESHWKADLWPGDPLVGFDYPDTLRGEPALTSDAAEKVVAFIRGWIRFPEAGTWRVQFHSNDGLRVKIGGVEVYEHDGRHTCQTRGWQEELQVPQAGWYPVEATYFQRLNTSCLLMEWAPPGEEMGWTPNDAFGFRPR
jgi:hypothetical protein